MNRTELVVRERGSGSVLAVALIGCLVALTILTLPVYLALAIRQSVSAAADAAALAAADVAVGLAPGYPCGVAARVAAANGSALASCDTDGLVVTVSVSRYILGIVALGVATAGPPSGEAD